MRRHVDHRASLRHGYPRPAPLRGRPRPPCLGRPGPRGVLRAQQAPLPGRAASTATAQPSPQLQDRFLTIQAGHASSATFAGQRW